MNFTTRPAIAVSTGVVLTALALSGCTIDASRGEGASPEATNVAVGTNTGSTTIANSDEGDGSGADKGPATTLSSDRDFDCRGGDIEVTGSLTEVTLRGSCGTVVVSGSGATVHADDISVLKVTSINVDVTAGVVGSTTVQGAGLELGVTSTQRLTVTASNTTITVQTGTIESVTASGSAGEYTLPTVGEAEIAGLNNTFTSRGSIRTLTVSGSGNDVRWSAGQPKISNTGTNNDFKGQ